MPNYLKLIASITLILGVQLIALWTAGNIMQPAPVAQISLHTGTEDIHQGYQPSYTIGSPRSSWGSGTR